MVGVAIERLCLYNEVRVGVAMPMFKVKVLPVLVLDGNWPTQDNMDYCFTKLFLLSSLLIGSELETAPKFKLEKFNPLKFVVDPDPFKFKFKDWIPFSDSTCSLLSSFCSVFCVFCAYVRRISPRFKLSMECSEPTVSRPLCCFSLVKSSVIFWRLIAVNN